MDIKQLYHELSEKFSSRHPVLEEIAPLYLLAMTVTNYDPENLHHWSWTGFINVNILTECLYNDPIGIPKLNKEEFQEISRSLIDDCLILAQRFSKIPRKNIFLKHAKEYPDSFQVFHKSNPQVPLPFEKVQRLKSASSNYFYRGTIGEQPDKFFLETAILYMGAEWSNGKEALIAPIKLVHYLAKLAGPGPRRNVYCPMCGDGTIFVAFDKEFPQHYPDYYGNTNGTFSHLLCTANTLANKLDVMLVTDDVLANSSIEDHFWLDFGVDLAIGILPLKGNLDEEFMNNDLFSSHFKDNPKWSKQEFSYVKFIIDNLSEYGKAVIVVSDNFLSSKEGISLRKQYIKNDWIEKIISLPVDTFQPYERIKTSIIVFNKNKESKGIISFDGWNEPGKYVETRVEINRLIKDSAFDLRPKLFASVAQQKLAVLQIEKNTPLKNLVELTFSGRTLKNHPTEISENEEYNVPFIQVKDLLSDNPNFKLDLNKIERKIIKWGLQKTQIIDFSVILVSLIGTKLKPTYFDYTGQPIVIGSNVLALKLKENVNIEYLLTQLRSQVVKLQAEILSSGAVINRITRDELLKIKIPLPNVKEQEKQILEVSGFLEEQKAAIEQVNRVKSQLNQFEYDLIANINHSLKNKLGIIVNDYKTLIMVLRRHERRQELLDFNKPIFDDEEESETLEDLTKKLEKHVHDASMVFNNALKLQKQKLNKQKVNLTHFLKNEVVNKFSGSNYSISVESSSPEIYVEIDIEAFNDVLENLIENSKRHGFINSTHHYGISFNLSTTEIYEPSSELIINYARILYRDNGRGFPNEFTFDEYIQYSNKAGTTQGTGIGGAVINRIIEMHGGQLKPISLTPGISSYSVELEILLPMEDEIN